FSRHAPTPCRVLDIGCGQGRDALFIARAGHAVVGVDLSPNGIGDLKAAAQREHLAIDGIVADITTFAPPGTFDIILIDRTLHMLAEAARLTVLARLLDHVTPKGWVLIADERANIAGFQQVIADHRAAWLTERAKGGTLFVRRG
ncbi:MAG TPA: class I SAM-dependent methyltransferase, partial [Rhodobacterales bacterium]|nr:class I SAM-dependent methyltransferase [Rhodobacterales bacterium]